MEILDINEDCLLEIMKYIIADCKLRDQSQGNLRNYADLVNFALSHEDFEAILVAHRKDLYNTLKFVFVSKREELEIDFSELQTTHTGKQGDAFWRIYADAIRENNVLSKVILNYAPESFQLDFLDHFEIIKHALENKKSLKDVTIGLNGYSLADLNNFGHITKLSLDVRMSAGALVTVCKSNPHLKSLKFTSTDILGRLSDIVPHCRNLKYLEFTPKPDIDIAEYSPLVKLPNLKELAMYNAFENGLLLKIFKAITKWQRPEFQPLKIHFIELLPHLSNITIVRVNSCLLVRLKKHPGAIELSTSYDYWDISRDTSSLEQSLATIALIDATLEISYDGLILQECSETDINELVSMLKIFNVKTFMLADANYETPIAKLLASMIPDESYALKSMNTSFTKIDPFASELVKIKSITSLIGTFSDWESLELLGALTHLESVAIVVLNEFEKKYSKALCSLLNSCLASGIIIRPDWCIAFRKIKNKSIQTLKISSEGEERSHIFEALSHSDLITIEELDVSECIDLNIEDILKIAELQPIKKLRISLTETNDIENLSDLTELEELAICDSVEGSLIKLFDQLAKKESTSLQCLQIKSKCISSEELVRVSRIRSLKKLDLCESQLKDCSSLMELANSNIEELTLPFSNFSLRNLFSAFAAQIPSRLQRLKIKGKHDRCLELTELKELSKIQSLKSLQCRYLCNNVSFLQNFKHLVKLNVVQVPNGVQCLAEIDNVESLAFFDNFKCNNEDKKDNEHSDNKYNNVDVLHVLADIQNLTNLNIFVGRGFNLTNVYQAFASKSVKLKHLSATIGCVEELKELTRIKSLQNLNLVFGIVDENLTSLGELSELKSLKMSFKYNDDDTIDRVLHILKCCRNLDRLSINSKSILHHTTIRNIHFHLKSVRDPTLQGPLTIILSEGLEDKEFYKENNIQEIIVILFENAYLKVFTSSKEYLFG